MIEKQVPQITEEERRQAERIAAARKMMAPKGPERRIAVMICKKSADGCTGAACFWAFDAKYKNFEQYKDSPIPVKLWGFFHCNGGDVDRDNDAGLKKKLNRLKEEGVEKVHLGVCMCKYCPHMDEICGQLEREGIRYEKGTH